MWIFMALRLFPFVLFACVAAAGCTIHVVAQQPQLNLVSNQQHAGTFAVDLSTVPKGEICYRGPGRDLCANGLHDAIDSGLNKVLSSRIQNSSRGPQYRATFKLERFYAVQRTAGFDSASSEVRLNWQFELKDPAGKVVIALARTTSGDPMFSGGDAESGVQSALTAMLEEIATGLDEGRW